ncbi:MAG: hypothetical protein IT166_21170 [Bryobacterales bacterium]|nr:hypothetical protein [Bryobacterales bacterium]
MSDYMFMLENHLNSEQARFLAALEAVCGLTNTKVFLAGGAMRDMLGGFPLRDLDFVVEGPALKLARELAGTAGASIVATDELRKSVEMQLPRGATVSLAMARSEKYPKAGGKPQVSPATMYEDLLGRDFTINAIALSLSKASRGLLMDPSNGLADIERRELRAVNSYVFYNDPVRLWRLIRLKVRLGFAIEERTAAQYANAREAEMEKHIPPQALLEQLRATANEPNPSDVLKAFDEEGLLAAVSPALTGARLNLQGFAKLLKIRQLVPFGVEMQVDNFVLLLQLLTEKLTAREKSAMFDAIGAGKAESAALAKLAASAKKLEKTLKSPTLQKPSLIYEAAAKESGEAVLFLFMDTSQRMVADRIRNYLMKYLPAAMEISDREIEAEGLTPGTPKFVKRKAEKIRLRLDARPRKPTPEREPSESTPVSAAASRRPI